MTLPSTKPRSILIAVVGVAFVAALYTVEQRRGERQREHEHEQVVQAARRSAEHQAATQTTYVKPWENMVECGIQSHDLRACDRRYWPGQVYPDEPIPGEKKPGIVCQCQTEQRGKGLTGKVCFADASEDRKRAYPCPMAAAGTRLSNDRFCARASNVST